jgi:hypothetical protein
MQLTRTNSPAYWIFLPALIVSGYVVVLSLTQLSQLISRGDKFLWIVAPASVVFLAAVAGPFCRALNRNRAALVCAAITIGSYWAFFAYALLGMTWQSVVGILFFWPILLGILLIAVPTTISCAKRLDPGRTAGGVIIGGFCGFLAMSAVIGAKETDRNFPRPLDPTVLAPDMVKFAKCVQAFASSHPDIGYPQSLAELGPEGSSCLPEALLASQSKGFAISYQAGEKDAAGRVVGYSIKAREVSPKGKDTSSIDTDQSGIVIYRYDGPHGKGVPLTYSLCEYPCKEVVETLWEASGTGPWNFGTGPTMETITDRDEYIRRSLRGRESYVPTEAKSAFSGKRQFTFSGYEFQYAFTTAENGSVSGFTLSARPHPYGVRGVRSYLFVDSYEVSGQRHRLHVYATPEDRDATPDDPLAERAEFPFRINAE